MGDERYEGIPRSRLGTPRTDDEAARETAECIREALSAPRTSVRSDYLRKLENLAFAALPFREDRAGQMIHPQSPAMVNLRAAINALEE